MHSTLGADIRFAVRLAQRQPWPFLSSVFTLALGLAAVTALFAMANSWLLRPLPFAAPDRLVAIWETIPSLEVTENTPAPAVLERWREASRSFTAISAFTIGTATLTSGQEPERLRILRVTPDLPATLGIAPLAGRLFGPEDARVPAADEVVLGEAYWRRRFGASRDVIGQSIVLNDRSTLVIGVAPARARLLDLDADVWRPLVFTASERASLNRSLWVVGRLRPGVTAAAASSEVDAIARAMSHNDTGGRAVPLQQQTVGSLAHDVPILFLATAVLLLLACANVSGLALARSISRRHEFGIRAALGATRSRLISQVLTESLLVGAAAGVAAFAMALWIARLVETLLPQAESLAPIDLRDARVFLFMLAAALVAALLFGVAPAFQSAARERLRAIREGGRAIAGGGQALLRLFAGLEIALALALLVAATLAGGSFLRLTRVDLGFDPTGVLTFEVPRPAAQASEARLAFQAAVLDRLQQTPGILHAGLTQALPLKSFGFGSNFIVEGRTDPAGNIPALWRIVSPDFFAALGMRVARGRAFTPADRGGAPKVAVVSASVAARAWPGQDPIGRRIDWFAPANAMVVVGVVDDVRLAPAAAPDLRVYMPVAQVPDWGAADLAVRSALPAGQTIDVVRRAVWSVDPRQPVAAVKPMSDLLSTVLGRRRFQLVLLALFAGVAGILAFVGVYGLLSYMVRQASREMGVRLALGASPASIRRLILRQGGLVIAGGLAVGLLLAWWSADLIRGFLVQVDARDVRAYAAAAVSLAAVAFVASLLPARRAAKIDPLEMLRGD